MEFEADLPRILEAMDQPSVDGINTWFASKAAAERGYKVALSGVGGDELFWGYPSLPLIRRAAALGRALRACGGTRAWLEPPLAYCGARLIHDKMSWISLLSGSVESAYFLSRGLFHPGELTQLMGVEAARSGLERLGGSPCGITASGEKDEVLTIGLLESTLYLRNQLLRDSDWASMAHSLELRTPLVDARLVETVAPLAHAFAGGIGKALLAGAPRTPLPSTITERRKTGFAIPIADWIGPAKGTADRAPVSRRMPWARAWARTIVEQAAACA